MSGRQSVSSVSLHMQSALVDMSAEDPDIDLENRAVRSDGRGALFSISNYRRGIVSPPSESHEDLSNQSRELPAEEGQGPSRFALSNKQVRRELVHHAMVSVGEVIVQEQLALAKREGYQNFGQVLFGGKNSNPAKVPHPPTGARASARASVSGISTSSSGVDGDNRKKLFIDEVQLQKALVDAVRASLNQEHLNRRDHPNHNKAVAVQNFLAHSVELQECLHDSVEYTLLALSAQLAPEVLHIPLPSSLRADYYEEARKRGLVSALEPQPNESRAERLLREAQFKREQQLVVCSNPVQATCNRQGKWFSLTQPDAPCPPLHMKVPSRFKDFVLSEARPAVLSTEHYHDMTLMNRQDEQKKAIARERQSIAREQVPDGESATSVEARHAPMTTLEKETAKLCALSDSYLAFLWSVDNVRYRDDIIGCVPQVISRATKDLVESRRTRYLAHEVRKRRATQSKNRRTRAMSVVSEGTLGASTSIFDDDVVSDDLEQSTYQLGDQSVMDQQEALLNGEEGPLLITDEEREQYRVQMMGLNQKQFDTAMAIVRRDLVWLFSGIDRRSNFADTAWITSGAGHSLAELGGGDDAAAPGVQSSAVAARDAALAGAVVDPTNCFDKKKMAPVFSWQLCSDGATSFKAFQERMALKIERGSAPNPRSSETRPKGRELASDVATHPSSPAKSLTARGESQHSLSTSMNPTASFHHHSSFRTTTRKKRAGLFAGVDPSLHPRQLNTALHAIRTQSTTATVNSSRPSAGDAAEAKPTSVTAQIVGDAQAAVVDRLRTAVEGTLPRSRGYVNIGLPHAQRVANEALLGGGQCEWYEQGRRFGPQMRHSDVPFGHFDLNTVSPLVSLQIRQSQQQHGGVRGISPRKPALPLPDSAKPPRRSDLPYPPAYMRWLF